MRAHLLDWQWRLYADGHRDRRNLLVHAATVPLFEAGTVLALASPWLGAPALGGLLLLPLAMALQGRGHRGETVGPVPFDGPVDVLSRIFAEQMITFPRFVLSGGFARAWRESGSRPAPA